MTAFKFKTPKGLREIGSGHPVFIIAEMSANHGHDIKKAYGIIDAAAKSGVDAIKVQTYTADTITIDSEKKYFQVKVNDAWKGQSLHSLYKKAYTPWEWLPRLKKYAESKELIFFSSVFDDTSIDFLEKMNVALYKVASFEIVDIPLLERIGKTRKPVIMSRGMASLAEVKLAIQTLKKFGCPAIGLLHCVSSYPANYEEMNLSTIPDLAKKFRCPVGISDHSPGIVVPITSVALGASIIEKHIIISRAEGGPDAAFSLEPKEFEELVRSVRDAEKTIGRPSYGLGTKESENAIFRKSLFAVEDIKKGEKLTAENVRSIRPGHGLEPKYFRKIMGKKAVQSIERGEPLNWKMIRK